MRMTRTNSIHVLCSGFLGGFFCVSLHELISTLRCVVTSQASERAFSLFFFVRVLNNEKRNETKRKKKRE